MSLWIVSERGQILRPASCGFLCIAPATYLPATFCAGGTVQWTARGEFTPLTPKCRVLFDLVGGEGLPVGVWFHFLVGCWMECESRTDLNKQGRAGELCS